MTQRIKYASVAPDGVKPLRDLEGYLHTAGPDPRLLHLIKTRASQINGCAYCIDMHTKEARARGETEQRLYALAAWRETPFFSEPERAALAWTEAVTLINQGPVPDALYDETRRQFSERALVELTLAVIAINAWNRLAVAFHTVPGSYQPTTRAASAGGRSAAT